jgi:CRP/FNR family transcriptional regulator, polysaccharide utilization system transcription regulator
MYYTMNANKGLLEILRSCNNVKHESFKKGDILFSENEIPKGIFIIDTGSVKLFKKDPTGCERIIYLATSGEILGLHSVVNNHSYASTAAAISDTQTSFISNDDFTNLVKSNNTYKLLVMKSLCSRIDSMEEHIVGVSEKMTEERLAGTLLMLVDKYGVSSSKTLNVNLTLDELASFTCTSKSYMKKIISDFSSKGIVSLSANTIKILDLQKINNILHPV